MELMTVDEVAEALRVPVATVRYWRAQGSGPKFVRIGKRIVCRRSDLERFVEQKFAESA
ncbi:hypothetical protein GCM10022399_20040 [Terrabacter ginsenosidimutans]|uniref:Helix-turn-helix domain-containing protein n=1 Tax=Terrabacter ginsenosidimutans TaxID=490575 RepID=A0ABP7DFE7_9MICO